MTPSWEERYEMLTHEHHRLRHALRQAREYVSRHDDTGHVLALVDEVLFGSCNEKEAPSA